MSAALDSLLAATDVTRAPLDIAETLARDFEATAVERDRVGGVPKRERDALRASGLLTLILPVKLGGAGATWTTTLHAVRAIARADGSALYVFANAVDARASSWARALLPMAIEAPAVESEAG